MFSKPNIYKTSFFILLIFANHWIWTIQKTDFLIFCLLILSTLFLFLSVSKPKYKKITLLLFFLLFIFQYQSTQKTNYLRLSPLELDSQQRFLNYYPSTKIPLAWWLEGRLEPRIFYLLKQNLFSALDQNIYFFAYHPREDNSLDIYPKFSFLLFPFFLLGLFRLIKNQSRFIIYLSGLFPLILLTIIGHQNPLGSFSLLPLIIISLYQGIIP